MFTHFYSDPHYSHGNIIKYCDRPFDGASSMNESLVEYYNRMVGHDDHVLWTGDCALHVRNIEKYIHRLNGRKSLVIGNHDGKPKDMARLPFEFVADRLHMCIDGQDIIVSHFPPKHAINQRYDNRFKDKHPTIHDDTTIVIHGHTHEKEIAPKGQQRIHVGVDAWCYRPAPLEEVKKYFKIALDKG